MSVEWDPAVRVNVASLVADKTMAGCACLLSMDAAQAVCGIIVTTNTIAAKVAHYILRWALTLASCTPCCKRVSNCRLDTRAHAALRNNTPYSEDGGPVEGWSFCCRTNERKWAILLIGAGGSGPMSTATQSDP